MCAARNNRLSVVNFLLDTIDDVGLDAFDTDHQTALHHAAIAGHTHVVRRLVHAGANTSTTNKVSTIRVRCDNDGPGSTGKAYWAVNLGSVLNPRAFFPRANVIKGKRNCIIYFYRIFIGKTCLSKVSVT